MPSIEEIENDLTEDCFFCLWAPEENCGFCCNTRKAKYTYCKVHPEEEICCMPDGVIVCVKCYKLI